MGPERRRGRDKERLKKKGASEQQCQKRATVVFRACCQLARHQLARGRCNWELWVIIATGLPLNTCASPLIFTTLRRGRSCFQRLAPVSTTDAAERRKWKSGGLNHSLHLQSSAVVVLLFPNHTSHQPEVRAAGLWPLGYQAGLRRTPHCAFQQVFVDPAVGASPPANSR